MPLFLVSGTFKVHSYPDSEQEEALTRIVLAADEEGALKKFEAAFSRDDPYVVSWRMDNAEAYIAIE